MQIGKNLTIAAAAVGFLWLIWLIDLILPVNLVSLGIHPRTLFGLLGILLSPFLHVNIFHLLANSGALFFLLFLALSYNRVLAVEAVGIIVLVGGGLVWVFGQSQAVYVGASGVIFGLIGFLIFSGYFQRDWKSLLISIVVLGLYSGTLIIGFIPTPCVSWSGHVFGFLSGILAAYLAKKKDEKAEPRAKV